MLFLHSFTLLSCLLPTEDTHHIVQSPLAAETLLTQDHAPCVGRASWLRHADRQLYFL